MTFRSGTAATSDDNVAPVPGSSRIGIGRIVVASLAAGLAAAVVLAFVPLPRWTRTSPPG
jgi:hypothetical protein